jgi:DNA polymerase iota
MTFVGEHELGKIPGIGFKLAQKIREFVLNRPAEIDQGLVYGGTKEHVTVKMARECPEMDPEFLEKLLAGPGSQRGIGQKIWCLLHAIDDTEVSQMRTVPRQISIEDSYIRLDTLPEVLKELNVLAKSLLTRMRVDLLGSEDDVDLVSLGVDEEEDTKVATTEGKKWLAHPKTLRLTTRPRQALLPDGTRPRSFKRISHSAPLPNFVFGLSESVDSLAEKLVKESLIGMFRKLHPERAGWNLSLVNLAVTNMAETAGNSKTANGRDIGNMFKRQEDVLRDFRVTDFDDIAEENVWDAGNEWTEGAQENKEDTDTQDDWENEEGDEDGDVCEDCGMRLPSFAMMAHRRFHVAA